MYAIIELTGATGAGKTTLAQTLGEDLAPASVLYVDASPDQRLTHLLAPDPPALTLEKLFGEAQEARTSREAIDWVFSDLTVSVGDENDLLAVGHLNGGMPAADREKLQYGLNRLIDGYDYVIVDGRHPLLRALLPPEQLHTLAVVTPDDFAQWRAPGQAGQIHTPAMVLNRYNKEPLPQSMEEALTHREVQLVGRLPQYASPDECARQLSEDFQNCLLKLNIPLHFTPPSG